MTLPGSAPLTDLYNKLRSYQLLGLPVLPIYGIDANLHCKCPDGKSCTRSAGKHPHRGLAPNGVKNASLDPDVLKDWVKRNQGGNWAIATGFPLPDGSGYPFVVDYDPRNDCGATQEAIESKHGKLPDTIRELTAPDADGVRGAHEYYISKFPVSSTSLGPGIDIKGAGGYVVCAPSKHASGAYYEWDAGCDPSETPIAIAPPWLLESTTRDRERPHWTAGNSAKDTLLGEAFSLAGMLGMPMPAGVYAVACPWLDQHSDGRGNGKDSSTVILPPIEGTVFGSFKCSHTGHCSHRTWADVIKALPPNAVAGARKKYPLKPALVKPGATDVEIPANNDAIMANLLARTPQGGLAQDVVNPITILTHDLRWQIDGKSILRFNEFSQQVHFVSEPPWFPDDKPAVMTDQWRDEDVTRLMAWIRRTYDSTIGDKLIYQAVQVVARRFSIHPVREFLNTLTWDGVDRVTTWLSRYIGAEDTAYTRSVGKWWLVSAVARVYQPGVKADYVLILEGAQGIRKSTALETLAVKREWFSDSPFELGSKDSYLALRGKWIIEMAELDSLSRSDSNRAKAFFSSPCDTYRAPYGRESMSVDRQCVFAGSVNHSEYLKDPTGARRYWPVACGAIDLEALRHDREQLWAQAVQMYGAGEKWYPATPEAFALCTVEQSKRGESDAWSEPVINWMSTAEANQILKDRDSLHHPGGYFTAGDILGRALRISQDRWDRVAQLRSAAIMASIGWKRDRLERQYIYTEMNQS